MVNKPSKPSSRKTGRPLVIAVAARKGGVGKTTVACGLASVLSHQDKRVLVVDLDPQSNAAYVLGVDPTLIGTAAWLTGGTPAFQHAADNLDVLAGGPELADRNVQRLDPHDLSSLVNAEGVICPYDVIICDCPPGDEHLERLAMRAAHVALVVTDAHPLAVTGAGRVLEDLESDRKKSHRVPDRIAVVLSRLDTRRSMDRGLEGHLKSSWPALDRLTVRQDVELAAVTANGVPVMSQAPDCRGALDLLDIARWLESDK